MSANGSLRKHDRARSHGANLADELNVFDRFGEELQTAAILFEKAQSRAIDLTVDQETNQTLVAQARREGQFALRDVERGFRIAEWLIVQPRDVFVRRVAHRGVITIDVECAH